MSETSWYSAPTPRVDRSVAVRVALVGGSAVVEGQPVSRRHGGALVLVTSSALPLGANRPPGRVTRAPAACGWACGVLALLSLTALAATFVIGPGV